MENDLAIQIGNYVLKEAQQMVTDIVEERTKNIENVTVDVTTLAKMLSVSESSVYKKIGNSEEFIKIESDYGSKRLWYADQVDKAWRSYLRKYGSRGIDRLPRSEQHRILVEER